MDAGGIDRDGRIRLHQAAVEGQVAEVARLIIDGANVGATDKILITPLHMACQQCYVEMARLLLTAGAPVDARDTFGNTPLWKAVFAFRGDPTLIQLLLAAGADPDSRNNASKSPRDMAPIFDRPGIRDSFA